ncbi:MAG: class I SAM-dependent methyltransferase [Nitrospirota bacterium]
MSELANKEYYDRAYEKGYGIMFPESPVIRWYERVLKYELGIDGSDGKVMLDFGCGNGTHSLFFRSKGFAVYGSDIDERAVELAKTRMRDIENHFYTMRVLEDIRDVFKTKFDVILANQVLYYLDSRNLETTLQMFDSMLNKNGIVFFSMVSTKHYLNNHVVETREDGFSLVRLKGRLEGELLVNFTKDLDHLKQKFAVFEPLYLGHYDYCMLEGDSRHHFAFTGRKR